MKYTLFAIAPVLIALAAAVQAQSPAARVGDPTSTAGLITGPGAATVLIGGQPAARITDSTTSPALNGQDPCIGGPILQGSTTVLIQGLGAARVGDEISLACGLVDSIVLGAPTVLIGD